MGGDLNHSPFCLVRVGGWGSGKDDLGRRVELNQDPTPNPEPWGGCLLGPGSKYFGTWEPHRLGELAPGYQPPLLGFSGWDGRSSALILAYLGFAPCALPPTSAPFLPSQKKLVAKGGKKKKQVLKFTLDCTHPVEDGIMDAANFVSHTWVRLLGWGWG